MNKKELEDILKEVLLKEKKNLFTFLTGAGISAASGIPTFRGKDGYWVSGSKNYKAQEIGTYKMFQVASMEVWKWFLYRKSITEAAQPNTGHHKIKEIEDLLQDRFVLISQNVDSLHKKAGSSAERTYLIHGDFDFVRCGDECSRELYPFPEGIDLKNRDKDIITEAEWKLVRCPKCGEDLRPNVLWFDEYYNEHYFKSESALRAAKNTGVLFIIGTSGATNLPMELARTVLQYGGYVFDVNIEDNQFTELLKGKKRAVTIREDSSVFLEEVETILKKIV